MNIIIKIYDAIKSVFSSYEVRNQTLDDLCHANFEKLVKDYDLDQSAKKDGEHDLPRPESKSLSAVERKVVFDIEKRMSHVTQLANEKLVAYNTTLSNTDLNDEKQRIRNITEANKLRLQSVIAQDEQQLSSMKESLERNREHFEAFKSENELRDDAQYPDSKIMHISIVLIFFLVESLANGYFFARGSEFGLLGGVNQSIIVAALNIGPAFVFCGLILLRYINHISITKKVLSYIFLSLYIVWVGVFNLVVAHYRDLLATNPENAVVLALNSFIQNPLGLADINSWLLLVVGIVLAVVAAADGMLSDDPYPRYGKLQRRLYEMQSDFEDECSMIATQVEEIRSNFLSEIDELQRVVMDEFTHAFHLAKTKPALVQKYNNCMQNLESLGDALIHRYRSENRKHRTASDPVYFDETRKLQYTYQLKGAHDDDVHIRRQKKMFDEFPKFVQNTANEIEILYAEFFNNIRLIEPNIKPNNKSENAA